MFNRILQLLYPKRCGACDLPLLESEDFLCTACRIELPKPGLFLNRPNWLSAKFDGLFPFVDVHAFFLFSPGSKVQHLMHQIKYKGQQDLGQFVGSWCGAHLKTNIRIISYDLIIPIPLFSKKRQERGYNQAACIAQGISEKTQIPCNDNVLRRTTQSQSLVGQNRISRYETLSNVFEVVDSKSIIGKHVLLVDDTLTTGATFLAAAEKIKAAGASEISFLALAALK